jgi:hypothetical protein
MKIKIKMPRRGGERCCVVGVIGKPTLIFKKQQPKAEKGRELYAW